MVIVMQSELCVRRSALLPFAWIVFATAPSWAQGAAPSDDAFEMGSPPGLAEGLTEEQMWPAASAEGWAQPCLVRWQRTFDDALEVARAEQRPLLVAVNMDGEIASEHFAGVRYREAATAALMEPYACVVASVYRHTPRDYDEHGFRVECPRFGTVTCGEHIEAERELFGKYFDGKRVSPRHIVLDLDGAETLDVYFSWDTASVFTAFVKGVEGWPDPIETDEPTLEQLVRSADVADRQVLERMYAEGDRETKRRLLQALLVPDALDQVEVLRAAIFGLDLELGHVGLRALAACETDGALELMAETLKTQLDPAEREALLAAVARMAESSPRARTLAALHGGLGSKSEYLAVEDAAELARKYDAGSSRAVDVQGRAEAAEARPADAAARLEFAEALLARAHETEDRRQSAFLLEDARGAAAEAERLGASGARLDALFAILAAELGELERGKNSWESRGLREARARAVAAIEGGYWSSPSGDALDPRSRATLLRLFGDARRRAIRAAFRAGDPWPPEWLADVLAAHASRVQDPNVNVATFVESYDFLRWIGATLRAVALLDEGFQRFPDSPALHERLRGRLLWDGGPEGLERDYAARLAAQDQEQALESHLAWFAGYAALVAAEHHRRRAEHELALEAYARAIQRFELESQRHPDGRDNDAHYSALALAGRARIALERGELEQATLDLTAALQVRPDSAASPDGLNITPLATAKMLHAMLLEAGDEARAARVQAALDMLDPKLLEPPPSELPGAGRRGPRGAGR